MLDRINHNLEAVVTGKELGGKRSRGQLETGNMPRCSASGPLMVWRSRSQKKETRTITLREQRKEETVGWNGAED